MLPSDIIWMTDKLQQEQDLPDDELKYFLEKEFSPADEDYLYHSADDVRKHFYGNDVYLRGLIEFTNYCKNDCLYCGIRRSNRNAERYRLTESDIWDCCRKGYELGFRTFVLQGGEDPYFTDDKICEIVRGIKREFPDCAVTLSIGEKERDSYQAYFDAGADRYLLRHETADPEHYGRLHPSELSAEHRQECLYVLKDIGYQVGCGIMVGSPYQETRHIIKDIRFMQKLKPHMIGIGPFIPHHDTPFAKEKQGTLKDTLRLLSILRLIFPQVLLPATTALGTIHPLGREMGIKAGANVVMPNLSPTATREKYLLYDGKICTGDEAAECSRCMERRMESIGYKVVVSRGDHVDFKY
ncbi:MAG: [FeFe] hydrogenase H-cluster radical SAM maturase HydE [Lachnospiraceae bacterium]|nr:[FeFe] hydrogenase H-cluster radical SAM maturase HydE [Lachnospiraceae bacterium]